MTRAALILFDDDDPAAPILGVSWPEFRVRQAVRAGAVHLVVVAGRITPQIVAAIDWAKGAGVSAVLARIAIEIADLFHPDETVLLMSGAAIVDEQRTVALMNAEKPTLLCVSADADPAWELIDARARWTGFARLDGAQVRSTAAMVGDWDLGSTLLRQAVGSNAERIILDAGDPLWRGDDEHDRALAAREITNDALAESCGWASRWIVIPTVRLAGNVVTDHLAAIARFSPWIAAIPLTAAIGFAWCKWPVLAALLLLIGFIADAFGQLSERATGQVPKLAFWRGRVLYAAAVVALAGLLIPPLADRASLVLAVVLLIVTVLFQRLPHTGDDPSWLADVPGYVVIVGVASLFGFAGFTAGLMIAAIHAFVSLAWLQNRLSRALTQAR
ncbi:MAG: hypothetical protein V4530_06685 [Pseudomonadota bacterium]